MISTTRKNFTTDERREMIFRHASQVFAAKGYAGSKIADIAAAAGISQGLLYRYFASKEILFTELIQASFAKLNSAAEALEQLPLPASEKIVLAIGKLLEGIADPAFSERVLLIAQASISEQIPDTTKNIILSERDKPYAVIARIMAAGQREGGILSGSPAELSLLFWTTIKGLALHKVSFGDTFSLPDSAILQRLFLSSSR